MITALMIHIQDHINLPPKVLWIFLLAGCGDPAIVTERPFREPVHSIQIGKTTRSEARNLLGGPRFLYDRDSSAATGMFIRRWATALGSF